MGVRAMEQIENLTAVGLGCALLSCIHRMTPGKESSYGVVLFQDDKTNVFHDSRDELMDFQNTHDLQATVYSTRDGRQVSSAFEFRHGFS